MANDTRTWVYILLARLDSEDDFCVFNVYAKRSLAERELEEQIRSRVYDYETSYEEEEIHFQLCQFPLPKYDN